MIQPRKVTVLPTKTNRSLKPRQVATVVALAACAVASLFAWQGNKGFSLWDEGFLWYGAQRVLRGEVPIRDFMAYDPGRYYWAAAFMALWRNNGIIASRAAVAIFQVMGLSVGLLLIAGTVKKQRWAYLILSTVTLIAWMYPRHKLFDISLAIFLLGALTYLIEKPVGRRYFVAGLCVGLVAVFGRNHGVYGVVGSLGVIGWLILKRSDGVASIKCLGLWVTGVVAGYAPVLLMLLLVPGFACEFWQSILFLFELKGTNLPLPIPWPWLVDFSSMPIDILIRKVLIGLFFIGLLIFGMLSIIWVVTKKLRRETVSPAFVAASFLALPYAHFAYSRSDVSHLAQGIFPMVIGILLLLSVQARRIKWTLAPALCAASVFIMLVFQPGWQCRDRKCVDVKISNSTLQVDAETASNIKLLRGLAAKYAPHDGSFLAVPFWPGAYALLERKSPIWEIYAIDPRSKTRQLEEIKQIKQANPGFALIIDLPLDGREALRFKNTHPLVNQYILDNFDRLPNSPNPAYSIFKPKALDEYGR